MIELTTTLLMLASAFTPATTTAERVSASPVAEPLTSVSIEAYVRDYFKDTPVLAEIARCESTFRQFNSKGNVLTGIENKKDIGLMQINTYYHGEDAAKLGFDIYTIDGNLGYAKWLYAKYGDAPWVHSSKCWNKYREIARK